MNPLQLAPKEFSKLARLLTRDALDNPLRHLRYQYPQGRQQTSPEIMSIVEATKKSNGNPLPLLQSVIDNNSLGGKKLSAKQKRVFHMLVHDIKKTGSLGNPETVWNGQAPLLVSQKIAAKATDVFNNVPFRETVNTPPMYANGTQMASNHSQFGDIGENPIWMHNSTNRNGLGNGMYALKESPDKVGRTLIALTDEEIKQRAKMLAALEIAKRNFMTTSDNFAPGLTGSYNYKTPAKIKELQQKAMAGRNIIGNPVGTPTVFTYPEIDLINEAHRLSGGDTDLLQNILTLAKGWEGTAEELVATSRLL